METSESHSQAGWISQAETVLFVARERWPGCVFNVSNVFLPPSPLVQGGKQGEKVELSAWEMGELCFDFSTSYLTLQSSLLTTVEHENAKLSLHSNLRRERGKNTFEM